MRRLLRPSSARAFVLELGTIAGALLSIVAAVKLVLPHHHHDSKPRPQVRLALAQESIVLTTKRDYLVSFGANPPKNAPGLDVLGFSAPYRLDVSGIEPGQMALVRLEVWRESGGIESPAIAPTWNRVRVRRDPDHCTCRSTFVALPKGAARYRLVIGAFPPGTQTSNPGEPLRTVQIAFRTTR